jgi:hypothetical protein
MKELEINELYDMRHFSNDLLLRCLILTFSEQKISFKHHLTPKNLITAIV